MITEKQIPQSDVFLTCQGTRSGCAVTNAAWVGQDGNKINAIWEHNYNLSGSPISSILVNSSIPGKPYTCKINYTGGSAIKVYPGWLSCNCILCLTFSLYNCHNEIL